MACQGGSQRARAHPTFTTFDPIALPADSRTVANDHVGTVTQASRATATKMAAINVPKTLVIAPPPSCSIRVGRIEDANGLLTCNSVVS